MTAQPLDDARFSDRELLGVLAERVGGMKETFDDFRAETRGNFDAAKEAMIELKSEFKADSLAIRGEMRDGFKHHDERITSLEQDRAAAKGGLSLGKALWGGALAVAGAVTAWFGRGAA